VAEGEAFADVTGEMIIGKACLATINTNFELTYTFEIPEFDTNLKTFPDASTDYISKPPVAVVDDGTDSLPDAYACT
jgi:hypothetical protein